MQPLTSIMGDANDRHNQFGADLVIFTVHATYRERRFSRLFAAPLQAIEQGMSLICAGAQDVMIADGDGCERSPIELYNSICGASANTHKLTASSENAVFTQAKS
ncbi:hypothetical protein [Methylobacterium tarhaniae]|uniref:hypothetical protein n=1 Tax=Methylobacterium tarhaniae TaxID=1187852 RepID=UPI003D083CC1